MVAPSAVVTVNGNTIPTSGTSGINVTAGSTITIALVNRAGVETWDVNCTMSDGINPNSAYPLIEATKFLDNTNFTCQFTMPAFDDIGGGTPHVTWNIGAALQFVSAVNVGKFNQNTFTFGLFVIGSSTLRLVFDGENLETDATYGVAPDINEFLIGRALGPAGVDGYGDLRGLYPDPFVYSISGWPPGSPVIVNTHSFLGALDGVTTAPLGIDGVDLTIAAQRTTAGPSQDGSINLDAYKLTLNLTDHNLGKNCTVDWFADAIRLSGNSADFTVFAGTGNGANSNGFDIILLGGDAGTGGTSGSGGLISLRSGAPGGVNAPSGAISIFAPPGGVNSFSGDISIQSYGGSDSLNGNITISTPIGFTNSGIVKLSSEYVQFQGGSVAGRGVSVLSGSFFTSESPAIFNSTSLFNDVVTLDTTNLTLDSSFIQWADGTPPFFAYLTLNLSADANHTLQSFEYNHIEILVTSSTPLTATRDLVFPLGGGGELYVITNNTTGGQSIQVIGTTGTGVTILNGQTSLVWSNGTNYYGSSSSPIGPAGGDLSGTYPNPTVIALRTKSLAASLASLGAAQDGYTLTWVNANNDWEALPTIAVAINMGGDVTGVSSSSTVAKINGTTVTTAGGALTTGKVLRVTGSATSDWGAVDLANANAVTGLLPDANQAAQTMAGDVTGTTAASVVVALRGKSLISSLASIGATQDGYVLTWVNSNNDWEAIPTTGLSAIGTINSQTKSNNGLVLLSNVLYAQTADASFPGMVSTGTQTFAGNKTLSGATTLSALGLGVVHSGSGGALTSSTIVNADVSSSAAIAGTKISPNFGTQDITTNAALTVGVTGTTHHSLLGNVIYSVTTDTSGAANTMSNKCLFVEDTSGGGTRGLQLPSPSLATGAVFYIKDKKNTFGTTNLTIKRFGSEKIDNVAADLVLSTNGQEIQIWTDGTDWYTLGNLGAFGTAGGDLSGTYPNPSVVKIQGKTLAASLASVGAAQDGYVLTWVNGSTDWEAKPSAGGSSGITALTGDVTASGTGSVAATIKTMQATTTATKTANYTITTSDYQIFANPSGAFNLTLPAPANGMVYHVWDISGTMETNNVTLVRNGSEKISGVAASRVLSTNWGHWMITSNGTDWFISG